MRARLGSTWRSPALLSLENDEAPCRRIGLARELRSAVAKTWEASGGPDPTCPDALGPPRLLSVDCSPQDRAPQLTQDIPTRCSRHPARKQAMSGFLASGLQSTRQHGPSEGAFSNFGTMAARNASVGLQPASCRSQQLGAARHRRPAVPLAAACSGLRLQSEPASLPRIAGLVQLLLCSLQLKGALQCCLLMAMAPSAGDDFPAAVAGPQKGGRRSGNGHRGATIHIPRVWDCLEDLRPPLGLEASLSKSSNVLRGQAQGFYRRAPGASAEALLHPSPAPGRAAPCSAAKLEIWGASTALLDF